MQLPSSLILASLSLSSLALAIPTKRQQPACQPVSISFYMGVTHNNPTIEHVRFKSALGAEYTTELDPITNSINDAPIFNILRNGPETINSAKAGIGSYSIELLKPDAKTRNFPEPNGSFCYPILHYREKSYDMWSPASNCQVEMNHDPIQGEDGIAWRCENIGC
ncbi:MAG: hypothetical protein M1812_006689 [Candelaria pacifica]|nr:MAG: hypothetical protein M1812_006689 [Candelaria pacifica]